MSKSKRRRPLVALILALAAISAAPALLVGPTGMIASSHREAPITALDPKADITDVWAFRSFDVNGNDTNPASITMIMGVDPFAEPANGPNWFPFDPKILYEIHVDNNNTGEGEIVFQFRFSTQYQLPTVYTGLAGFTSSSGGTAPGIPGQISTFSNPGLNFRQTYTVTMIKNGVSTAITNTDGSPFYVVPANAGPRTINYAAMYAAGTYTQTNLGISTFTGTVDDPFFIDLGGAFDTGNFHTGPSGIPGVMNAPTDPPGTSTDGANGNFAADTVSGYAVNVLALQVPIAALTSTGVIEPATSPHATIGIWGTTARTRISIRRAPTPELDIPDVSPSVNARVFSQIQRLGNPLINELIIGTGTKDFWSMSQPVNDSQFASYDLDPGFTAIVDSLYSVLVPGALYSPPAPRNDLLPLVEYLPPIAATGTPSGPVADLLRLNTGVAPTAPGKASRLGLLAGDGAGFPNGRRLADDVVDITLRVAVGGVLAGNQCGASHTSNCDVFPNNVLGDGVNVNDVITDLATDNSTNLVEPNTHFHTSFPYVDYCPSGRNRQHIDPGDVGCNINPGDICATN
ncbi:MAG TPA: DUF4331 domain-containing protein [Terriglobia bacterium]|nr:DUF4331 domain-containing protein [Terriglobia bacterium]